MRHFVAVPVAVVALVLASAFMHALWNALLKRMKDPENASFAILVVCAVSSLALTIAAWPPLPPPKSIAWCIASGLFEAGYFVTLARALSRAPLGPVYTVVRGGALVVVWPVALLFLHEELTVGVGAGVVLVLLGLAATGFADAQRDTTKGALARNLGWAAVSAVFVAGYHLSYKMALAAGGAPFIVVSISLGAAAVVNALRLDRDRIAKAKQAFRDAPGTVIVAGILGNVGFAVFLLAMSKSGAGVVITLRNTSILFAQVFAAIQGDRPKPLGVLGALAVTGGAFFLAR